ncbi:hypothetical protein [Streptomyces sp. NPDC018055]|uniref:hypothetical protein n=1 Tax=Streptomyces sp. NPDC018055 TaxID=3365038 RepID=UPI00378AE068
MSAGRIHELRQTVCITGREIFDVREYTQRQLVRRFLWGAPCLLGEEDKVRVISTPCVDPDIVSSFPASRVYRVRALCLDPDLCAPARQGGST